MNEETLGIGRLSDIEKGEIIGLWNVYQSVAKILPRLTDPRQDSVVRKFIQRWRQRNDYHDHPTPGYPSKVSERDRRRLLRAAKANRSQPLPELTQSVTPHVSIRTVKRVLAKEGIKKWRAKKRPKLTEDQAASRLHWALHNADWTEEDWKRVIWSDEYSVEKSKDPRTVWVFCTPYEKWDKEYIQTYEKGPGVKLMVWGCFWGRYRGTFVPLIVHSVNRFVYHDLLHNLLPPVLQIVQETTGAEPIFMEDNSKVHKNAVVKEWEDAHGVEVMEWPACSPDLNPIEHLWRRLKERMQDLYPEIGDTKGGPEAVRKRLAEVLPLVWDTLESDYLDTLWQSMPSRVCAVIAANGWYTKY